MLTPVRRLSSPIRIATWLDLHTGRALAAAFLKAGHQTTVINLTSGSSAQAREAVRRAEQRGARYLDGAVTAIPSAIGTEQAVILHSGPEGDLHTSQRSTRSAPSPTWARTTAWRSCTTWRAWP